jgi:hypothetical protein
MRHIAICFLGAAGLALAQVGAPQLGWVPDGARFRPVYGLPAAAAVGPAILTDQDYSLIAASPGQNYVLVSAAQTGAVGIYTPEHGLVPLKDAGVAPDLLVLSPRGSAAAIWFFSINQVQLVTGMPDAPTIRQVDASFLGSPSALALSDDGAWFAGTFSAGTFAFGPDGEVNRMPVENVTTIAFFQGTHDLATAGPAGLQKVTGVDGFVNVSNLLVAGDVALQPIAVAATSDNRTLLIADKSGIVTAVDVGSGTAMASDCGCQPEGLFGMGSASFRLTGIAGGSFKLFDAAHGEVLFAPLALAEQPAATDGAAQ